MSFETYLEEQQAARLGQFVASSQGGGPSDPRSPCQPCGGQSCTGGEIFSENAGFLCHYHSNNAPYSLSF